MLVVQGKWNALRDAADAYSELSEFARREKQWLLQRVCLAALPAGYMHLDILLIAPFICTSKGESPW